MAKDRYVPSFPEGEDTARDFYQKAREWAKKHGKASKISTYDKSSSTYSYILSYYDTWGEVLEAARANALKRGVTTKEIIEIDAKVLAPKAEGTKPSDGLDSGDYKAQVYKAKTRLNILTTDLGRYEPGSKEYNALLEQYNDQIILVSDLTTQYESALTEEKDLDKYEKAKEKIESLKKQRESLKQARQQTADLGLDTSTLDAKLKTVNADLTTERTTVKNFTPKSQVDIAAENKAKAEAKAQGKPYVAPPKGELPTKTTTETPATPSDTKGTNNKGTNNKGTNNKGTTSGEETPKTPVKTKAQREAAALNIGATLDDEFAIPETLFDKVPELKAIFEQYTDPKLNMSDEEFMKKIRNSLWYTQNSLTIKNRYVQLYNYQKLREKGQDTDNTAYAKDIRDLEAKLAAKARKIGSDLASNPELLRQTAERMYITNSGIDDATTTEFIAKAIRPLKSAPGGEAAYSGEALKDYQAIQAIAKANGFKINEILPWGKTENDVLQGLATGMIDADRLAQDARKLAAQGQPQYVRDLLAQGYNLEQVYAPYKNTMAAILEVNPDEIDLNDQTLRAAISDKGDMNMFDFKKALRKDKRWEYTEQARQDVSNGVFKVLRDFGFQG